MIIPRTPSEYRAYQQKFSTGFFFVKILNDMTYKPTFISWKYLLRFSHLKKWQFVFSCPILMYWSKGPVYMYECLCNTSKYVYCISKNLINRCRRFWWINFQRMMLLQWQGHKKKKRKGRSSWIPRWLAEIQRTILVNWDKDLRVYDYFCFWFCTYLNK